MTIEVTQYMRPDGRRVLNYVDIDDACRQSYESVCARGWNVAAELLTTGHVSVTVETEGEDIEIDVVENGPAVIAALESIIAKAALRHGNRGTAS
jgi:hypothetical protein